MLDKYIELFTKLPLIVVGFAFIVLLLRVELPWVLLAGALIVAFCDPVRLRDGAPVQGRRGRRGAWPSGYCKPLVRIRPRWAVRALRVATDFEHEVTVIIKKRWVFYLAMGVGILYSAAEVFQTWYVLGVLGHPSLVQPFVIYATIVVQGLVSILPGNIGGMEGVHLFIFTVLGIGSATSLIYTVILRIGQMSFVFLGLVNLFLSRLFAGPAAGPRARRGCPSSPAMRIGLFTDIYLPSRFGTELATERVRHTLEEMGHRVYVYAPETPGYLDEGRRVLRFRSQRLSSNPASRLAFSFLPVGRSYRDVLDLRLDVAQAQTVGAMGILARRIAQAQGVPLLYAHHSMYPAYAGSQSADAALVPSLVRTYTKWFASRADAILAPTPKVKRLLSDWGVERPSTSCPREWIGPSSGAAPPRGSGCAASWPSRSDRMVLLTVSRLVREKNLDFLLEAFRRVARSVPDVLLLVVGDGPYRGHLQKHAHRLGIGSRTLFAGLVPNESVDAYYQASDIFVFPSVIESQGLVILEALACGLPVVALKDDAYAQFVRNGETGHLVTPRTPAAFAAAARELARDPALRESASRAAARLSREYTLEKMAAKLVGIYHETIRDLRARSGRGQNVARLGRNRHAPKGGRP